MPDATKQLVKWLGEMIAILEEINLTALRIAHHASAEESPIYGCIDSDALRGFAGSLGDVTSNLKGNEPMPETVLTDPTDDLPDLPSRAKPAPSEEQLIEAEANRDASKAVGDAVVKRSDGELAEMRRTCAAWAPSSEAAKSELLPFMFAVVTEFARRYYPDAERATVMISFPKFGRETVHLPIRFPQPEPIVLPADTAA